MRQAWLVPLFMTILAGQTPAAQASDTAYPGTHEEEWRAHRGTAPFELAPDALMPAPSSRPAQVNSTHRVVGYFPYWEDPALIPYDHLTHLSWFSLDITSTGGISDSHGWGGTTTNTIVSTAHSFGVKVLVTAVMFDETAMCTLLNSSTNRANFVNTMKSKITTYGADGISVDFETPTSSCMAGFESLISELAAAFHPLGLQVDIAMPAVDWSNAFHYSTLAATADTLFIMGYNYHWSGGSPGPVDPLYGGGAWGPYSLDWTVKDYLTKAGAYKDKIILGLPTYGMKWPTTSSTVPGTSAGTGTSIKWKSANAEAPIYGVKWDSITQTPYYSYSSGGSWYQVWYQNVDSMEARFDYSSTQGLGGVGFWALNYDGGDAALWAAVDSYAGSGDPLPDPTGKLVGFVRENDIYTGAPIVGATVELDNGWSTLTDSTGYYVFENVPAGITYTVTGSADCYTTVSQTRYVEANITNWSSIALVPQDPCTPTGGCPSSLQPLSSTTPTRSVEMGTLFGILLGVGLVSRRRQRT